MGVPQKVSMVLGGLDSKLKPKSISFKCLYLLSKIFYALISLCTMFKSCKYYNVWAIVFKNNLASDSVSLCSGFDKR